MASEVTIRFKGDGKSAVMEGKAVKATIDGLGSSAQKTQGHFSNMAKAIGGVALKGAALGLGGLAAAVAVTGIKFDNLKQQAMVAFTTMLGSATKAQSFMNEMQKFAASTPFEFPDLIRTSQTLLSMGFAAKEVKPTLTALGDAMSGLGRSNADLNRAALILGQIRATGHLMGGDMLQLQQLGINVRQALVESTGKTMAEVQKAISSGAVSSQMAIDSVTTYMEKRFGGMMEKQSHTFGGLLSTLKDTFTQISGTVMAPFFELATKGMQRIVDLTSGPGFTAGLQHFATVLSKDVQSAVTATADWVQTHWADIKAVFVGVADTVTGVVIPAIILIVGALDTVASHIGGWKNLITSALGAVAGAWVAMKLAGVAAAIQTTAANLVAAGVVSSAWKAALISTGFGALAVAAGIAAVYVMTHWEKVKGWFENFMIALKLMWTVAIDLIKGEFYAWVAGALLLLKALADGAAKALGWVPGIGGKLKDAARAIDGWYTSFKDKSINSFKDIGTATANAYAKSYIESMGGWQAAMQASAAASNVPGGTGTGTGWGGAPINPAPGTPGYTNPKTGMFTPTKSKNVASTAQAAAASPSASSTSFHLPGERTPHDCSAFTQAVFKADLKIDIGSTTQSQQHAGPQIPIGEVQPGDLLFFTYQGETKPGHVGIAIGGGQMVHDHGANSGVSQTGIDMSHFNFAVCPTPALHDHPSLAGGAPPPPTTTPAVSTPLDTSGGPKKPKVDPLTKPAATAAVADTKKALGDVVGAVMDVPKALRDPINDALSEAKRLLTGLVNKGELAKAKKDIADAKHDIANALKFKDVMGKAADDIGLLSHDLASKILPPEMAKAVRAQIENFNNYVKDALEDHRISDAELAHITALEKAMSAKAKQIADEMAYQQKVVKDAMSGFADLLTQAASAAGILIQQVYKPADIAVLSRKAAAIAKALQVYMPKEQADALKGQLDDLNTQMKTGLDQLTANVNSARDRVKAAWGLFSDDILAAFDRMRGSLAAGLDDVNASFNLKTIVDNVQDAEANLEGVIGGDSKMASLMRANIAMWREYYADLAAQNFEGAKALQQGLLDAQDAETIYLDSLPDEQKAAAQAILDAGGSLIDAIKAQGDLQVQTMQQSWDQLTAEQRVKIQAAITDAQTQLDGGAITLPEALQRVGAALIAAGMSPADADKLLHDPIAASLGKAVAELSTAIGTLTAVLVAIAKAMGVAVPDLAAASGAAADSVVGPWRKAQAELASIAASIGVTTAQLTAMINASIAANPGASMGSGIPGGYTPGPLGYYNGGVVGRQLARAYGGMVLPGSPHVPMDSTLVRAHPGETILSFAQSQRVAAALASGGSGGGIDYGKLAKALQAVLVAQRPIQMTTVFPDASPDPFPYVSRMRHVLGAAFAVPDVVSEPQPRS